MGFNCTTNYTASEKAEIDKETSKWCDKFMTILLGILIVIAPVTFLALPSYPFLVSIVAIYTNANSPSWRLLLGILSAFVTLPISFLVFPNIITTVLLTPLWLSADLIYGIYASQHLPSIGPIDESKVKFAFC